MTINQPLIDHERLAQVIAQTREVAFAVLIGSRANHTARDDSDWDIAVLWEPAEHSARPTARPTAQPTAQPMAPSPSDTALARLGQHEALRHRLARCLNVTEEKIDLIDLASAGLAMKAAVAEEGVALRINNELAWAYFQSTTWRELEDHYWDAAHAA